MVEAFTGKPTNSERCELDDFLDNYFNAFKEDGTPFPMAEREKENLKMVFQFYGDRNRRTHLGDRMELP